MKRKEMEIPANIGNSNKTELSRGPLIIISKK